MDGWMDDDEGMDGWMDGDGDDDDDDEDMAALRIMHSVMQLPGMLGAHLGLALPILMMVMVVMMMMMVVMMRILLLGEKWRRNPV